MLECLSSHLPEDYILQIQERARRICNDEPAVISVFLTDTTKQSGPIVGQLERLISESRTEDRAVSAFKVAYFCICARDDVMEMIADE